MDEIAYPPSERNAGLANIVHLDRLIDIKKIIRGMHFSRVNIGVKSQGNQDF